MLAQRSAHLGKKFLGIERLGDIIIGVSFFLGRQKIIAGPRPGMALWRERLFAWMLKSSESPMEFFGLPPDRVVELGSQVQL